MGSEVRQLELQRINLLILARHGQPEFTDKFFPYTSGQIGPYFIQSVDVEKDGADYHAAIKSLAELVCAVKGTEFDVISGGESRDWDFSNPVAYELKKPHAKVYKDGKALGAEMTGRRIVHVADLQNEGSSIRDLWHPQIEKAGGELVHAFFYVDRLEDGVEVMSKLGIPSDAVVPMDKNAWQILLDNGHVSKELYDSLNHRSENRAEWAHKTLRTHIDHLIALLSGEKTREKAEKVLVKGYPEIRAELEDRMRSNGYTHVYTK